MKNLSKVFKFLMINAIICSLIQNPFVNTAMGAGINANDIAMAANTALYYTQEALRQRQQINQQLIASGNIQRLSSQYGPNCVNPDKTPCNTVPAKYFPKCPVSQSISSMPVNVCSSPNPSQINSMMGYEALAQEWVNFYDLMNNDASNSPNPTGIACLKNSQKELDSQLMEMINNLTRLQTQLNKDKEIFKENNRKILEDMNTANDELFGTTDKLSKNNLKIKTQDPSQYLSQDCQSVIGKDTLKTGSTIGLNGILQSLVPTNKIASDFISNKSIIESDVHREVEKIAATIAKDGLKAFFDKGYLSQGNEKISAIDKEIAKQKLEFDNAKSRIDKELGALGYVTPEMDENFSTNMDNFIPASGGRFEQNYINDCVTGPTRGASTLLSDIFKTVRVNSREDNEDTDGAKARIYSDNVKRILADTDPDKTMDVKLEQIKNIETYPMVVTIRTKSGAQVIDSPYNIIKKITDDCKVRYAKNDADSNGVTHAKKVERGRAALQELRNLNSGYASKLSQKINSQVIDCNGQASKSGSEFCNEDTLKTSNINFCVAQASKCADNMKSCYAEANRQVNFRKTKMELLAKTFNANVVSMIDRSNRLLDNQKASLGNLMNILKSKFQINSKDPKDIFVPMPEFLKDKYGVAMAGDGNINSFLNGPNSMPETIDKLIQVLQNNREKVTETTDGYITLQKEAMDKQRGRWDGLYNQCKGYIDKGLEAMAKHNNDIQKNQNDLNRLVYKYCDKYNNLKENPNGGCSDKAKSLVDTWDKIVDKQGQGRIDRNTRDVVAQYDSTCQALNNESLTSYIAIDCEDSPAISTAEIKERKECKNRKKLQEIRLNAMNKASGKKFRPPTLADLCEDEDTSNKKFLRSALGYLPESERIKISGSENDFIKALTSKNSFPTFYKNEVNDNHFFADLKTMISKAEGDTICGRIIKKQKNVLKNVKAESINNAEAKLQEAKKAKSESLETLENEKGAINSKISHLNMTTPETDNLKKEKAEAQKELTDKEADITKARVASDKEIRNLENEKKILTDKNLQIEETPIENLKLDILEALTPVNPNSEEGLREKLSDLGERMDTPCDSMNTNMFQKGYNGINGVPNGLNIPSLGNFR